MHKVEVSELRPGMILGRTLHNDRGDPLLRRGIVLSDRYLELMRLKKYTSVFIRDYPEEDFFVEGLISERLRTIATRHIAGLLQGVDSALKRTGIDPLTFSSARIESVFSSDSFSRQSTTITSIPSINQVVESIVDEVLETNLLPGLTALKPYDGYTFAHSVDVMTTAILLGKKIGLSRPELLHLANGCLLHDVGKVFIETSILNKPGKLDRDE